MTNDELDAIPVMGRITYEIKVVNGERVRVPAIHDVGALWMEDSQGGVILDANGIRWMVGKFKGELRKIQMQPLS